MRIGFKPADIEGPSDTEAAGKYHKYFMRILLDELFEKNSTRRLSREGTSHYYVPIPERRIKDFTWWSNNYTDVKWDGLEMFVEMPLADAQTLKVPGWFPDEKKFRRDPVTGEPLAARKTYEEYGAIARIDDTSTNCIVKFEEDTIFNNSKFGNLITLVNVTNPSWTAYTIKDVRTVLASAAYDGV